MLKIGEFSKLSHLTVKALRFYEKEKLLVPAFIDEWTGYRFYETSQLEDAAKIKDYSSNNSLLCRNRIREISGYYAMDSITR